MEMNRGRIGASGTNTGHVHALGDLADVEFDKSPFEGAILMYIDGKWRIASVEALRALLGL